MRQPQRQKVILVPDPRSKGAWLREVRRAFEPHFECCEISHRDCRTLAPLALLLEPLSLLVVLGLTCILSLQGLLQGPLVFVLGAFLLAASLAARSLRGGLFARFEDKLSAIGGWGFLGPHAIAHGFGAYLIGLALRSPGRPHHNVILAGAMLPSRYDWAAVFRGNPVAFRRLRNEVGRLSDWRIWPTFLYFPFCPDLGWAGWRGFCAPSGTSPATVAVQDTDDAFGIYKGNGQPAQPAVFNVPLAVHTRSDRFIRFPHARTFWRPFLWDIDPDQYKAFLDLCLVGADAYQNDPNGLRLPVLLQEFGEAPWGFLGGLTLAEEIGKRTDGMRMGAAQMYACFSRIWISVAKALDEEDRAMVESRDEAALQDLKPQTVIQKAIEVFLKQ